MKVRVGRCNLGFVLLFRFADCWVEKQWVCYSFWVDIVKDFSVSLMLRSCFETNAFRKVRDGSSGTQFRCSSNSSCSVSFFSLIFRRLTLEQMLFEFGHDDLISLNRVNICFLNNFAVTNLLFDAEIAEIR